MSKATTVSKTAKEELFGNDFIDNADENEANKIAAPQTSIEEEVKDMAFVHPLHDGSEIETGLTRHSLSDDNFIDGLFGEMNAKKDSEAVELTSNYIDFKEWTKGDVRNFIFTGFTTFTKPDTGEVIPAVSLMSQERKSFIAASTVIVQSLRKCEKIPCGVRIKFNGLVKSAKGQYFDMQVFVL